MIRVCIDALARLSRQEQVSRDSVSAMGAPNERFAALYECIMRQAVKALHTDGVRTQRQLNEALREATDEELEALLKRVEAEVPNPFEWQPPTEPFCSHCDKRPSWWAGSTRTERTAKGYREVMVDYEGQVSELQYRGRDVCCDECQAVFDECQATFVAQVEAWSGHDPDLHAVMADTRHCLEMSVTRCLGDRDWAVPE